MLYVDRGPGRPERWFLGDAAPDYGMRISEDMLRSVVFVCSRGRDGTYTEQGTAFGVSIADSPTPGYSQAYLVTARHVIDVCERTGDRRVHLRINTTDGRFRYVEVGENLWWKPNDAGVDIAFLALDYSPDLDLCPLDWEVLGTEDAFEHYSLGIGDPLAIVGLFTSVTGRQQNRPIVRSGNIAAMPDEPILEGDDEPPYLAYLVEMRSTGGLSGSPVLAVLGYARDAQGELVRTRQFLLIGLIRGHWPSPHASGPHHLADDFGQVQRGIATVTPVQYLTKMLMSEPVIAHRRQKAAEHAARQGKKSVLDSATLVPADAARAPGRKPERLAIDATFEDAARMLALTPRPEGGWPKDG